MAFSQGFDVDDFIDNAVYYDRKKAQEVELGQQNPIKVQRLIQSLDYGTPKWVNGTRSGIIIECNDSFQFKSILATQRLGDWQQVKCTVSKSQESSIGCIYNTPIDLTEEEVLGVLKDYKMTKAYSDKITIKEAIVEVKKERASQVTKAAAETKSKGSKIHIPKISEQQSLNDFALLILLAFTRLQVLESPTECCDLMTRLFDKILGIKLKTDQLLHSYTELLTL
ncbi:unnamed protein product [Mytilus edulis]|uniref:Uncharacterized protein n=1 Tax=Mytilus edulis TaxID=6550 RepID=A0A8S3UZS6_MYTED|nr:unnamed protein product [Mytilus edulis]